MPKRRRAGFCRRRGGWRVVLVACAMVALGTGAAQAQSGEERQVVAVVERLFEGMLARDTVMMRETMAPAAQMLGRSQDGHTLRWGSVDGFLESIGRGQGPGANERIYNPEVRIDGNLATVWTFYTLHVGERFSHCGYDSFQLARTSDGWKIVSIADTRRTDNCEVPGGVRRGAPGGEGG